MLIRLAFYTSLMLPLIFSFVAVRGGAHFPTVLLFSLIAIIIAGHIYGIIFAYLVSVIMSAYTLGLIKLGVPPLSSVLIILGFNIAPLVVHIFGTRYKRCKEQSAERIIRCEEEYQSLLTEEKLIKEQNLNLEKQVLELARLYEVTKAMSTSLEFQEIFQILKSILQKIFKFSRAKLILAAQEGVLMPAKAQKVYLIQPASNLQDIDEKKLLRLSTGSASLLKETVPSKADDNESDYGSSLVPIEPVFVDNKLVELSSADRKAIIYTPSQRQQLQNAGLILPGEVASFMSVPLVCEDSLAGLLTIEDLPEVQMDRFLIVAGQFRLEFDRVRLYEKVQQLAIMDGLTGVFVRRYLMERCQDELRRSIKHKLNLSCLIADIDHFKICNDNFGHLVGDAVLREMAGVFRENVREVDFISRYGGEEFCMILPDTPKSGGIHVAERLRKAVEEHTFKAYDETVKVTISIGVTTFPEDASDIEQLIDNADQAMYKAKAEGRNKVCAWNA